MQLSPIPQSRQTLPVYIQNDRPAYQLEGPCYLDDEYRYEGEFVYWDDTPNEQMRPLNDLAFTAKKEYLDKLDAKGREVAAKTGMAYTSLADALEQARALAAKQGTETLIINKSPEILGKKKTHSKVQKIEETYVPEMSRKSGDINKNSAVQAARNTVV